MIMFYCYRKFTLILFSIFSLSLFAFPVYAANPITPISPADNIQDPGDPSTPWGGCTPTDSNCYVSTPWTTSGNDIYYNTGNVGIGTDTPEAKLHVNGTLKVTGSSSLADITPDVAASSTEGTILSSVVSAGDPDYDGISLKLASDDTGRIAYFNNDDGALHYFACSDEDCSGGTDTTVFDPATGKAGKRAFIILDSSDNPYILFHKGGNNDASGGNLMLARYVGTGGAGCTGSTDSSAWTCTTVVATGNQATAEFGSDGFLRIAYVSGAYPDFFLKYIKCNNAGCTSSNITGNLADMSSDYFSPPSLKIGTDGFARIAYWDSPNENLGYAVCDSDLCTSPTLTTVDYSGEVAGYDTSLVLDINNHASISYYSYNGSYKLDFAHCTNNDCSAKTLVMVDDSSDDVGAYNSIALGADGFARISYFDAEVGNRDLKYVQCSNSSCSTKNITTLDSINMVGRYTSLSLSTEGFARIAYHDFTNHFIKFAKLNTEDGQNSVTGNDIGSSGSKFNNIYGQTINADSINLNGSSLIGSQWANNSSDIYFNNGNVGIGTVSPGRQLDILYNETGNTTAYAYSRITAKNLLGAYGGSSRLEGYYIDQGNNEAWKTGWLSFDTQRTNGLNVGGDISFWTKPWGIQSLEPTQKMVIKYNGNVGIGTSNPTTPLFVQSTDGGTISVGNGVYTTTLSQGSDYDAELNSPVYFHIKTGYGAGDFAIGNYTGTAGLNGTYGFTSPVSVYAKGDKALGFFTQGQTIQYDAIKANFVNNGDVGLTLNSVYGVDTYERMRILGNGNIGIGTANPEFKLDILGTSAPWVALRIQDAAGVGEYPAAVYSGQVTNNYGYIGSSFYYNAGSWRTSNTSASNILFKDNGATVFTNDTSLTANTNFTPTARMTILTSGSIGIGTTSPEAKLEVAGSGCFDTVADTHCTAAGVAGDIYYGTAHSNWSDVAEKYPGVEELEPGDVVMLDTGSIEGASIFKPYITKAEGSGRVLGVISEHPGLVLGDDYGKNEDYSLALSGRVPVKVTDENGTIKAGDRLTLSLTKPGRAMKQTQAGQSFGIALESQTDQDTILMFVDLSYQSLADLNLDGETPLAITSLSSEIVNGLTSWFASTANGITDFFANRVHTQTLCVGVQGDETCITKTELDNLLQGQNTTPSAPTPPPSPALEPTPDTTTPTGDATTPPETQTTPDTQAPAAQETPSPEIAPTPTN